MTGNLKRSLLIAGCAGLMLFASACCSVKEEQLAAIRQLRVDEKQLNADIETAEKNRATVARELASRQGDLQRCNDQKAAIERNLSNWPNIWPDWDPNPPAPAPVEPAPTTPKKRR
jgi:septal ring factor EnvC (AmiA/AmiB activator)